MLGKTHRFLFSGLFSFSVPQPFLFFLLIHFCIGAYPEYYFGGLNSYLMYEMKRIFPNTALLNPRKTAEPQAAPFHAARETRSQARAGTSENAAPLEIRAHVVSRGQR